MAEKKPAVALQVEDGSWRVHTDPRGDARLRKAFAPALARLAESVKGYRKVRPNGRNGQ